MNKNKKIAMAVVATVMAGAMVVPFAACDGGGSNPGNTGGGKVELEKWNVLDGDGNIDYSVYEGNQGVTLNIAIGYNSEITSTSFAKGTTYTLPDGKTYTGGSMKPAWQAMGNDLHIEWNDVYKNFSTGANLKQIVAGQGTKTYAETDLFTTDLSEAVNAANNNTNILNLADYLEYMPNFKAFLEDNPVVYLSLLQDGMSTTDGSNQKIYVAPYFDGNDDIERYCIIRQDWADIILNGNDALATGEKFTDKCTAVAVQAFMPGTGSVAVDVTEDSGDHTTVGKVYKNYANVFSLVKASGDNALKTAYLEASNNAPYTGDSGNIIDLMNAAIEANPNVTGDLLAGLFRAYVDACYTKATGTNAESYYTNRSDLFNGYDAAWDVDDLVAMLRCVMTNQHTLLTSDQGKGGAITNRDQRKIYGIAPRTGENDRTPDMVRLACQLYGARGGDSRYEYTYIDNGGNIQDARNDETFYKALDNMNKLTKEGLIANFSSVAGFKVEQGYVGDKKAQSDNIETFMMYDYCQSQTLDGFYKSGEGAKGLDMPTGYNFAPVLTPVSKWDVNGDDDITADEYFRFTESWRSVKTSGLALNGGLASNKKKLKAALQFVDYLYSEDGQIVSTYGPKADNANGTNGFWYNEVQTTPVETTYNQDGSVKTTKNYFTYKGVKYAGVTYKDKVTPKITDALYDDFRQVKKAGVHTIPQNVAAAKLNFTNFARYLVGSTLPVGVKDQSFENQLTSQMGQEGAAKVGAALANGVIKSVSLKINENNWWYTCVPTGLPLSSTYLKILGGSTMNTLRYMSGEAKKGDDKAFLNLFAVIILNGATSGRYNWQQVTYDFNGIEALVEYMSDIKGSTGQAQIRENSFGTGWNKAKDYWDYLKTADNS